MDKNAQLTTGSPCEYCSLPSVQVFRGVPVCGRHLQIAQNSRADEQFAKEADRKIVTIPRSIGKSTAISEEMLKRARLDEIDEAAKTLGG